MADKYVDKVAMQENITKTKEYVDKKHTQVNSLPIPSIDYLHRVYQYVGTTGNGYTHNYFYECVSDGQDPATYSWVQTSVQPASSLAVEDSEGTALASRDTMQFGTGFNATDDSENEKTVVEADLMQSGDMDDIVTPLPSVAPKKEGVKYSTTEQVVGEWIDGKPIYQRTWKGTITENVSGFTELIPNFKTITNFESIVRLDGILENEVNSWQHDYYFSEVDSFRVIYRENQLQVYLGNAYPSKPIIWYVTCQYTKTTDTATT